MRGTTENTEKLISFGHGSGKPRITVAVSLHNYGQFIIEALESVRKQTFAALELIVIDDASTDDGPARTEHWLKRHGGRFIRATLVRRSRNAGLAGARNLALKLTRSPLFFVLDADNAIYPRCLERLAAALAADRESAFAYPVIEVFGDDCGLMGTPVWSRERLAMGNYIDAMSLLRTERLREVDGYARMSVTGWEDYDLWCRFAERGWRGIRVPEILARYRTHSASMLNTITRRKKKAAALIIEIEARHPWLQISGKNQ